MDGEPRLIGAEDAAGALQAHTLAVNDSAICFLAAARERGDEFGPFAWRQEVSHPLNHGRGRRRRALISDAVFTYLRLEGNGVAIEQRFLELDRATLSVDRLAADGACAIRSSPRSIASSPGGRERFWSAAARPPSP